MDNREFDDIIKQKLESLNTNGSDDAWDLFKEKWESEPETNADGEKLSSQDEELQTKIKMDMQKLRIPFNSKHWVILKAQLESEALFKKKLFVAKSVELIILAFLVLGILNLWPIQKNIYQIPVYDIPMVASVPVDKATSEKHIAQEKERLAEQNALNSKIYNSTKELVQSAISTSDNESSTQNSSIIEKGSIENTTLKNGTIKTSNPSIQFPFINTIDQKSDDKEASNSSQQEYNNEPMASLLSKDIENLIIPIRPTGYPEMSLVNATPKKEENTFVSFTVGPKMNLINSPFDPVYGYDPYITTNTNYNISAKVHKEIGPLEIYVGLGYTKTSYVPRLVRELYEPQESQFNVTRLENIEFKTFNIPLGVKLNIVENKNIEFYTTAGIDMNVIADSEYTIEDKPVNGFRPAPAPAPPSGPTQGTRSKLSQKEFNKGILSGGTLKDNLYASASIGLGLNWKTSSRTGIFIEPRYSHFISSKGIGPNEDKVHSLSIDLGVKYQLN